MPHPVPTGLFVTGTDTGVGKTAVTSAIVRILRADGIRVGAYKPVASGAERGPTGPVWSDAEILHAALDRTFPIERICPQRFLAPLAPPVAAAEEGKRVDRELLRSGAAWWQNQVDLLVVEGAGGLLSPISEDDLVADLACDLGYPLLIVARLGLGAINHTLLTVEAAHARGLRIAGIVMNDATAAAVEGLSPEGNPVDLATHSNPRELAKRCPVPILAVIGHSSGGDLLAGGELRRMDWSSLARRGCVQPASE